MEITSTLLAILTLFTTGGWFVTYKSHKRQESGKATQSEAEGWAKMQQVYRDHIGDLAKIIEKVQNERNAVYDENHNLKEKLNKIEDTIASIKRDYENKITELKKEYEMQISDLRKELSRQGRKLENVLPFSCGVADCQLRRRVNLPDMMVEEGTC